MLTEDQAFVLLKRRIFQDRGLDCEQYKENYLKRRIAVRLRATECGDYLDYLRILRNRPDEYTKLMNELTVNVTQFFRDPDVYTKIKEHIIPRIYEEKKSMGSKSIRVWSVGCASGEEPYSMAILLDNHLGSDMDRWNIRILGSDIDDGSLALAKKARYTDLEMLEGLDIRSYFDVEESKEGPVYHLKENIRRRVKFEKLNLLEEREKRHYDIILCRNVLIYFGRDVQTRIIESLSTNILRDGYLVLGKSETLGPDAGAHFKPVFPRERIYRYRKDGGGAVSAERARDG